MIPSWPPGPRLLGPLLAELRAARGWSQQRLAAELCAASGVPTLTRHEVSRWERQLRLPGDFWSAWLATVLGVPGELLAGAAASSRRLGVTPVAVDPAGSRARLALLTLAHRWAADPGGGTLAGPFTGPATPPVPGPATGDGYGPARAADRAGPVRGHPADGASLATLRRWDDLLGGGDLAGLGARRLRRSVRGYRRAGPAGRRRMLPSLAESAQLAGWLAADAGDLTGGLVAYRLALRAAVAAGEPPLAGHVLGSASHLLSDAGDAAGALVLARIGYAASRATASPGLRALLLHRVALAAALGGRRRAAGEALAGADRAGPPEPGREPQWLYWLDAAELAAMTGRTLVALGRAAAAVPLLTPVVTAPGRPRRSAVYGGWLARAHLGLGAEPEACAVAGEALLDAVRSGSPRAVGQLTEFRRGLARRPPGPATRGYARLLAATRPYLPSRHPWRPSPPVSCEARRDGGTTGAGPNR
ncbi:helix-turn-helix domain-containing protein [Micromonospora chalcea]|uniref:helix-turn-helix domain-containing protein n=1 Tax=Micromonospora TaxID=1873 RepID=UPI00083D4EB4|nr:MULTISPECIES: helix-turn-helix transcriptional regulator [Micromonospora]ODB77836.1 transcriptional regulator [Micromonospora sp. II]WDQ02596.1 helix-turn-helix transcriptional regulator [Micromonospora chalcea]